LPAWDIATALLTSTAVLAAERDRRLTGCGRLVRIALADVALSVAGHLGLLDEALLIAEPRGRYGNALFGSFGRDYRTRDDRYVIVLALTPRQWTALAEATGLVAAFRAVETQHGVDLRDEGARFVHRADLAALVERWVREHTLAEIESVFAEHGVLWGPYRTFKELVRDEPRAATPTASPIRFDGADVPATPAPALGADTHAVLGELLRFDSSELAELAAAGVIEG
jgi:2-methylfumaryl-CoA isomerase